MTRLGNLLKILEITEACSFSFFGICFHHTSNFLCNKFKWENVPPYSRKKLKHLYFPPYSFILVCSFIREFRGGRTSTVGFINLMFFGNFINYKVLSRNSKDETNLKNVNISGKIWNRLTQPWTQFNSEFVFVIIVFVCFIYLRPQALIEA